MRQILFVFLSLPFMMLSAQHRTTPATQSQELGKVRWYRSYDQAAQQASKQDKPILILFQEVPGCATCRNYGHDVLTHPLMVEAIEQEFIPLAIFNNKGGEDARILKRYGEPSWNNPVVRIVDQQGKNLVKGVAGNYSAQGLFQAMKTVLAEQKREIPPYMHLLGEELFAAQHGQVEETYFSMYCFWSGEGHLGQAKGVLATEPGFMGGREVVKVTYDKQITSTDALTTHAQQAQCSPIRKSQGYRPDKDPQYYLKHSDYKYLPLTDLQKTKINSALGQRKSPDVYLSPTQNVWLRQIRQSKIQKKVLYTQEFASAWYQVK
ncbi:MAG: VPGUxxT family thioredoxin-like (seleno)protein, type 2 [Bacteroidota bacterium]